MPVSLRVAVALWIAILTLISGVLGGCSGSSSTSGGSPPTQVFNDISQSRLERYAPSDVSYDTVYAPWDVDTLPSFKGGQMEFLRRLDHPEFAMRKGISGKVWVGFIVSPSGDPTHVQIVESVHPTLDREVRLTTKQTNFTPGKVERSPVPVKVVLPVTFRLKEEIPERE